MVILCVCFKLFRVELKQLESSKGGSRQLLSWGRGAAPPPRGMTLALARAWERATPRWLSSQVFSVNSQQPQQRHVKEPIELRPFTTPSGPSVLASARPRQWQGYPGHTFRNPQQLSDSTRRSHSECVSTPAPAPTETVSWIGSESIVCIRRRD